MMISRRAILAGSLASVATFARGEEAAGDWWSRPGVRACCSLADAVYADDWRVVDGVTYATVTGGGPRNHPWAPIGRTYVIERDRLKDEPGNPTGHGVLFLVPSTLMVICFLPGTGI